MAKWWCRPCRKPAYSSFRVADKVRHRANRRNRAPIESGDVYWCVPAGAYHVTSMDKGDHDRQQAGTALSTDDLGVTPKTCGQAKPVAPGRGQRRGVGNSARPAR